MTSAVSKVYANSVQYCIEILMNYYKDEPSASEHLPVSGRLVNSLSVTILVSYHLPLDNRFQEFRFQISSRVEPLARTFPKRPASVRSKIFRLKTSK